MTNRPEYPAQQKHTLWRIFYKDLEATLQNVYWAKVGTDNTRAVIQDTFFGNFKIQQF